MAGQDENKAPEFGSLWGGISAPVEENPEESPAGEEGVNTEDEKKPVTPPATPPVEEEEEEDGGKSPKPQKEEDGDPPKPDAVEESTNIFGEIEEQLELDDILALSEDVEYESNAKGFAKMMSDNLEAHKAKWKEEAEAEKQAIIDRYESQNSPKVKDLDPENEAHANHMLTEFYKSQDMTDEEITEEIATIKELGDLSKKAKIAQRKLAKVEEAQEQAADAAKIKAAEARQAEIDDYINSVKTGIDEMEEIAGFKPDAKMKKNFKDYLFKKDKDGKTPAQKANEDPDRRIKLAFLDFVDFNKEDFEIKATTEAANKAHKKATRFTSKSTTKGKTVKVEEEEVEKPFEKGFLNGVGFFGGGTND